MERFRVNYDTIHDTLYVAYGEPAKGYGEPDDDMDLLIYRFDMAGNPSGFTVVGYSTKDKTQLLNKLRDFGVPMDVQAALP